MTDVPEELKPVVKALADTAERTRQRVAHACQVRDCLLGLSALALSANGFNDSYIAQQLGSEPKTLSETIPTVRRLYGRRSDDALRRHVAELWDAARRAASPWVELDNITYSYEVIGRHGIDTSDWPLAIEKLDLWASEFVHQDSAEAIIVYSLQRWNGSPRSSPTGGIAWDKTGRYNVEFITAGGERGTVKPETLGLSDDDLTFTSRTKRDCDAVYERAIDAVRRHYGALPPFDDAVAQAVVG